MFKKLIIFIIFIIIFIVNSINTSNFSYYSPNQRIFKPILNKHLSFINHKKLFEIKTNLEIKQKLYQNKLKQEKVIKAGNRFMVTFYTLSVASCGKTVFDKGYGLTRTGYNLKNKNYTSRIISVDPNIIPLKSNVELVFENSKFNFLNGTYHAEDTGGAIKNYHIDLYLGEFCDNLANQYGVQYAKILKK